MKLSLKKINVFFVLLLSSIFILIGNAGRLGVSFNLVEIFLVFTLSILIYKDKIDKNTFIILITSLSTVIISIFIGLNKFGFQTESLSYGFRLILHILVVYSISLALEEYSKYYSIEKLIKNYINLYLCLCILSFFILVKFPYSTDLWNTLESFGIKLVSPDPHINRMVSTYFDPNFFGNIILLPLIFSLILFIQKKDVRNFISFSILFSCIILTFSRTAILSMFVLILLYLITYIFSNYKKISKGLGLIILIIPCMFIILLMNEGVTDRLISRFSSTNLSDGSTMARFNSYQIGNQIFSEHPILGYGYNFSLETQKNLRGNIGIDSSLQATLINFGFLGFTILSLVFIFFLTLLFKNIKNITYINKQIIIGYIIYLLISVFFLSSFNQLLYYSFWLIPTFSIGIFLYRIKDKN